MWNKLLLTLHNSVDWKNPVMYQNKTCFNQLLQYLYIVYVGRPQSGHSMTWKEQQTIFWLTHLACTSTNPFITYCTNKFIIYFVLHSDPWQLQTSHNFLNSKLCNCTQKLKNNHLLVMSINGTMDPGRPTVALETPPPPVQQTMLSFGLKEETQVFYTTQILICYTTMITGLLWQCGRYWQWLIKPLNYKLCFS